MNGKYSPACSDSKHGNAYDHEGKMVPERDRKYPHECYLIGKTRKGTEEYYKEYLWISIVKDSRIQGFKDSSVYSLKIP